MENNRVKVDICGVSIALITDKDESYVTELADEIAREISPMISAGISKDRAAILAAFNYLDELKSKKPEVIDNSEELNNLNEVIASLKEEKTVLEENLRKANEKISQIENQAAVEPSDNEALLSELQKLKEENDKLRASILESVRKDQSELSVDEYKRLLNEANAEIELLKNSRADEKAYRPVYSSGELSNPMRPKLEAEGMVDYYEKN